MSLAYNLKNFAIFTGLSALTASYGRVSRVFSLASWEPVIFADGSALAITNLVRALHDCIGATDTPVLSIGPMPINIDELKYYDNKGNVNWDARFLEENQENMCDDSYITTERVMTRVRDLSKLKVRYVNNGFSASDVVIASRCLNIADMCPLDLNHTTGSTGSSESCPLDLNHTTGSTGSSKSCPLDLNHTTGSTGRSRLMQGFRPTTTSVMVPTQPPPCFGA